MSSAASESSGASLSSRSSPDSSLSGHQPPFAPLSKANTVQSFTPYGAQLSGRRSSTPAAQFLPPRFWGNSSSTPPLPSPNGSTTGGSYIGSGGSLQRASTSSLGTSGNRLQQTSSIMGATPSSMPNHADGGFHSPHASPSGAFVNLTRRTSFGMAWGGGNRLSALTALGVNRSTGSVPTTDTVAASKMESSGTRTPTQASVDPSPFDLDTPTLKGDFSKGSPVSPPPVRAAAQRTRTVYLPGPDGILVESRPRRKSSVAE